MENRITSIEYYVEKTKLHAYPGILQIFFVFHGSITVHKVEKSIEVKEGEFTFVNAGFPFYVESDGADILDCRIKLEEFKNIFDKMEYVEFITLDEIGTFDSSLKTRTNNVLVEYLLKNHFYQDQPYYLAEKKFNEDQLVLFLFNYFQLITHKKNYGQYYSDDLCDRYYSIVRYIYLHINEKIFAEDILKENPMNQTYFSQFMKKIAGIGFKEYVNYHKLMNIMLLMVENDISLADIAAIVGITDMKSFYHLFKKYYQTSPANWKKEIMHLENIYRKNDNTDYIDRFMNLYEISTRKETTTGKVNNYLLICKANKIDLYNKNLVIEPYCECQDGQTEYYFPYQYFSSILSLIDYYHINLTLKYEYKFLNNEVEKMQLINVLSVSRFTAGLQMLKKWRIIFLVNQISQYDDATKFKKIIEEEYPGLEVTVKLVVKY